MLEKINIFEKFSNFIRKILKKNEFSSNTYLNESSILERSEITSKNMIEILKEEQELLEFQDKYEKGVILEEYLTEDEKEKLINLYKRQISQLKLEAMNYERQLNFYKNRIIKTKNKIK